MVLLRVPGDTPQVAVRLEDAPNLGLRRLRGEVVHDKAALLVAEAGVELDAEVHGRPRPRSLLIDQIRHEAEREREKEIGVMQQRQRSITTREQRS